MMEKHWYLMLCLLSGILYSLIAGCAWTVSGYSPYPYYYGGYSWYPYNGYYWRPYYYDRYLWYPYSRYSWWPYRSYYRDHRHPYRPRDWYDDRPAYRPGPPQNPPPDRRPRPLRPLAPKGSERQPLDKPMLRNNQLRR
ncbi:MAG: hypothetical protein ACYCYR_17385 [Desulfobulbaceae bacterium]